MGFFFEVVYIVNYIDVFLYIEPFLHSWDKAYLIMMNVCFDVFLDSVGKHLIEYFWIDINMGNLSEVLLLCGLLCSVDISVIVTS